MHDLSAPDVETLRRRWALRLADELYRVLGAMNATGLTAMGDTFALQHEGSPYQAVVDAIRATLLAGGFSYKEANAIYLRAMEIGESLTEAARQ